MRHPGDVTERLRRTWSRSRAAWLADPAAAAVALPLHPPTGTDALADPAGVHAWITGWKAAGELAEHVTWEERRWAHLGAQQVPVRWQAHGAERLCRLAGAETRREWTLLEARVEAATAALTEVSALEPAEIRFRVAASLAGRSARWLQMPPVDAELCVQAAAWLLTHPDSGLRIRQVPLPGMHTKWLQAHRSAVEGLVGAARADGSAELGLRPAPVFHDLVVLDPQWRAEGSHLPRASRLDPAALAATGLAPWAVIICENSETVQVLPDLRGAVAVSGAGYAIAELLAVPWIQDAPVLYWGDLDADGLRILDRARHHHDRVTSALMDRATLDGYRELTVTGGERTPAQLTRLTPDEAELHAELSATGERLEQERIELSHASATLRTVLEEIRFCDGHVD